MTHPYRLHYAPDNASLIVRLALQELGVPFTTLLVDRHLALLEAQAASGHAWLNGAKISALDLYVAPLLRWCALYPPGETAWFDLQRHPALAALAARVEARDSARIAAMAEGLGHRPFTQPQLPNPPEGSAT